MKRIVFLFYISFIIIFNNIKICNSINNNDWDLYKNIDYSPFHHKIKEILKNTENSTLISNNPDDFNYIPSSSIMFSYTTFSTFNFITLQHNAMNVGKVRDILESRFITICLDTKCMQECTNNKIPNCIHIILPNGELPHSDFNQNAYILFTYIKHEFMYEALKYCERIFYFDADVIILRNPWIDIKYGRDENNNRFLKDYDLEFQRDRGRGPSCSGSVNTGQIYIKKSSISDKYFNNMREVRGLILEGKNGLDQDFVQNASDVAGFTICSLSYDLYIGHCFGSHSHTRSPLSKVVSYHAACVTGGMNNKLTVLKRFLAAAESNKVISLDQIA